MDVTTILTNFFIYGPPLLIAITLHEAAHGYVALRFGDDTALKQGRVTLNPFKHIDPLGTIIIPGILLLSGAKFLFGYAKPVPVVFGNLYNPRRDMVLVAAAGPATNIGLALASAFVLKIFITWFVPFDIAAQQSNAFYSIVGSMLYFSMYINILLAVFNMLPIPPLDGGRVAVGLLPDSLAMPLARLEPYGMFILLGAIFVLPMATSMLGTPVNLFAILLLPPVQAILNAIIALAGL